MPGSRGSPLVFLQSGISLLFLGLTVIAVIFILRGQMNKAQACRFAAKRRQTES
jgi:hypothetical protein